MPHFASIQADTRNGFLTVGNPEGSYPETALWEVWSPRIIGCARALFY
jgi:hypothetical protein